MSELVFSSKINTADIANLDIIRQAGEILNHAAMKVDYGLEDRVCDASELRRSWNDTHIPDEWLTFYSAVDRIPKSTIARVNEIQLIPDADDDKANSDDEEENEEVLYGYDISRKCEQIKCQFQIHYYQIHGGRKTVPLQTLVGQSEYAKNRSKESITLHNRLGTSESYKKVKKRRYIMKQYTILKKADQYGVLLPSHFSDNGWLTAAVDNKDWDDNSSLSGTEGSHQAVMALYQETTIPPATKKTLSAMRKDKSAKPSNELLPCQIVPPHEKPHKRPCLPDDFPIAKNYTDLTIFPNLEQSMLQSILIQLWHYHSLEKALSWRSMTLTVRRSTWSNVTIVSNQLLIAGHLMSSDCSV